MPRSDHRPLWIILIVFGTLGLVAFVGIIAAIAIPNLLTAMQRSKQKRTMADIRSIATAAEAYAVDYNRYPYTSDLEEVQRLVVPTYIQSMPLEDGWGNRFRYACLAEQDGSCVSYALASAGRDGVFEQDDLSSYEEGLTTNFDDDIVYSDGAFVRYPNFSQ